MNRNWLPLIFLLFITATASSQTLFTYGNYSVTADEFLRAYNKNNLKPVTDKKKPREYASRIFKRELI